MSRQVSRGSAGDDQADEKAGQVVWYPHLFKNFPQFVVIHTTRHLFLWPKLNAIR